MGEMGKYGSGEEFVVASDREEHEECERLTVGCCVDHTATASMNDVRFFDGECEPW